MAKPKGSQDSLPPAQPSYVLRGHREPIHALGFFRENSRLISGDAEGWIVVWDIYLKRPVAVWKAHQKSLLGVGSWGNDRIITWVKYLFLVVWRGSG
ncbi:hypothetical protein L228DRAFT_245879 [Xylona heveae TC161]|uniref:Uncharacterized protein n=1 Tax=Xylona heveae (strain CBS 132557 / TC161) TaxID=1328760 RepID=A0A165H8X8_XYLHT|nr:hypothetical protein L228DRAFT_245879 [Xylona heveae TC161]KZF23150.1 hypothetical protein L228DRAFT_245879 [Xylona heveae TC161]